jgi:hypothetical protein
MVVILSVIAVLILVWALLVYLDATKWGPRREKIEAVEKELEDMRAFVTYAMARHPELSDAGLGELEDLEAASEGVRKLLEKQPSLAKGEDARWKEPWIHSAASRGSIGLTATLLEYGADPDRTYYVEALERRSGAPLHYVTSAEMAQLLLTNGASVSVRDGWGGTPLHRAVIGPPKVAASVVRVLLDNGADIDARDGSGRTPLDVVEDNEYARYHRDVIALLRERGATR